MAYTNSHTYILGRRLILGMLALFGLLLLGSLLFVAFFDITGTVQKYLTAETGRDVTITGNIDIDWSLKPTAHITDLRIGNMEGGSTEHMFAAEFAIFEFDLRQLLFGRPVFPLVAVENASLVLEKDAEGNANWNFTDNPEAEALEVVTPDEREDIPAIGRLIIKNGKLRYIDKEKKSDITADINTVTGTAERRENIRLAAQGNFEQKPFRMNLTGGSVLTLRETREPYPIDTTITVGQTQAQIKGTLTDPIGLKGMNINLRLKGANAADIFPIVGIALPPTPPYDVTGDLSLEDEVWKFTDFKGRMGESDLSGDLTWDTEPERPVLTAIFRSKHLALDDIAGLIGATPDEEKIADPEQKQKAAEQEASPYVLPDAPLDISRVAAMDANVEFTGQQVISENLPLDDFYMKVDLQNRLMKITPVKFGMAGGDVAAYLTINARKEPVAIEGDFRFHRLSLHELFRPLEDSQVKAVPAQGYIGGTAKLSGYGKSLRDMLGSSNGAMGIGMEGGQLSNILVELIGLDIAESLGFFLSGDKPVKVRCIVGDFAAKNGVMHTNTLVMDTSDTNVTGKGTLNLKTEQLDIDLMPHPKDKSILTVRSPIHVGGTLKEPDVGIKAKGLIARGGVGVALGAVLVPLGILAFVEPGLGKDSDCAELIHEMNARTGKSEANDLVPENPPVTQ